MKLPILITTAALLAASTSHAEWNFDNSGSRIFDMRKNTQKAITITLESVPPEKIKAACDTKSRQLGNNGFAYGVMACSFWMGKTCHIILPHRADMRTIGHEVMHCYQGDWHAEPDK